MAITGRLNHRAVDNGDVEVYPSEYPFEHNSDYVPDPYTTPIKSIDDYEMYQIMEFFHSYHDAYRLGVDLQMIQAWLAVAPYSKNYTVSTVFLINMEDQIILSQIRCHTFNVLTNQGHCGIG